MTSEIELPMMIFMKAMLILTLLLILSAKRSVHWSYHENGGPEKWGTLSPDFALCGSGKNQSPIDIDITPSKVTEKWKLNYLTTGLNISNNEHMEELVDNGHTIQVTPDEGSYISLNGKIYRLKQFHFHTPSEHTFHGKHAPMEVHFVHQSDDEKFVVVAALVKEGETNTNMAYLIKYLPNHVGEKKKDVSIQFNPKTFLNKDLLASHYVGSLTTPPCMESVEWLVLKKEIVMSKKQISEFSRRLNHNNRPIQSLHGRKLTEDEIDIVR